MPALTHRIFQIDKDKQLQQREQRLATFDSVVDESDRKITLLR